MLCNQLPVLPSGKKRAAIQSRGAAHQPHRPRRTLLTANRHSQSNRRGVAVVEFAVVAPVFFLMVIGILEFGRALMVQQVLVSAARVGARQAVTLNATTSEVTNAVTEYADHAAVHGIQVAINPSPSTATSGDTVTVTTSIPFQQVSWMPSPWFLGGKTLTSESSMRKEGLN